MSSRKSLGPPAGPALIEHFREAVADMLPDLRVAVASGDWEAANRAAHRLQGSSAMFGVGEVGRSAASFHAIWGRAKARGRVKGTPEVVESAWTMVRACERLLSRAAS